MGLDECKWAKLLLETIYTIWFTVFNTKLKNEFKEYYSKAAEYAIFLFEDAQNRGIKPNETMYKSLIESLCYCEMNDKALPIVQSKYLGILMFKIL